VQRSHGKRTLRIAPDASPVIPSVRRPGARGTFAPISLASAKGHYDYLVRWVHNARERTRPYCPYEKKDLGPTITRKRVCLHVFRSGPRNAPTMARELQVQNMTLMPAWRPFATRCGRRRQLSHHLEKADPSSADASFIDRSQLKDEGKKWIRHFGCAGCHEISGSKTKGRIGTELTTEGSKPIERLDFALLTETSRTGGKNPSPIPTISPASQTVRPNILGTTTKGFSNTTPPSQHLDQGKIKPEEEKLRMPNLHLTKEQVAHSTTFLMGSRKALFPSPSIQAAGLSPRHSRRLVSFESTNCMGCPQIDSRQKTSLMDPGPLSGRAGTASSQVAHRGRSRRPQWLLHFLANPSAQRNRYQPQRHPHPISRCACPLFSFSENEYRQAVRFFQALSRQPFPYIPEPAPALTRKKPTWRSLFSSTAAPC